MPEISETLLGETHDLLDELIPVLQRSIGALQRDSNPLLQHFIQQEVECQEGLLEQLEELQEKLHNHLNPPEPVLQTEPVPQQDKPEDDIQRGILRQGNRSGTASLCVTMPDGERIHCRYVIDTFFEVIKKLGIERVRDLGIKCGMLFS